MGPGRKIASGLLLGAGLLLAAFAGGSAVAQDEDFCRAYAYQALDAAKGHYDSQCGGDENGRYSLDVGFHYSTCMGWGGEAMKWAARETNIRSQAFYNCKAGQAGVQAFDFGNTEYENDYPREGSKFNFCSNYAFFVQAQRAAATQQPCNLSGQNGRWDESFNFHRDWCMGLAHYDAIYMASEINTRSKQIVQCQAEFELANRQQLDTQVQYDMEITGKTAAQCAEANQRCEARALSSFDAASAAGFIATDCRPRLGACLSLAAAGGGPGTGDGDGGGAGEGTIIADVTGYEFWDGATDKCYLGQGDRATLLEVKPDDENWKHLQGVGETCDGEDFYLYDAGELEGL